MWKTALTLWWCLFIRSIWTESYLRVRLLKIEKFMFHNLKSEEAERRLSEQEKVFARRFVLLHNVPQLHLDTFVVCRSKNFVSLNLYEDGESPETVEMDRGDLYFIRYKIVKGATESRRIDLI